MSNLSTIILAGGKGLRMQSTIPKQFLKFHNGKLLIHYTLEKFLHIASEQLIVVCESCYRPLLKDYPIIFAEPGPRRQDSLKSALQIASGQWVMIHDGVRPFVTTELIEKLLQTRSEGFKAATLALPLTATIKEMSADNQVRTVDRSLLWESHTPQLIAKDVALQALEKANTLGLTVTDDMALAELLQLPCKLIPSQSTNIKITTEADFKLAQALLVHEI